MESKQSINFRIEEVYYYLKQIETATKNTEEELNKWEHERQAKQSISEKQTDSLITKITQLREELGIIKDNSSGNICDRKIIDEDFEVKKPNLDKLLEISHPSTTKENKLLIFPIDQGNDNKEETEQYYKNILEQTQLEYKSKLDLIREEYEERLKDCEKNTMAKTEYFQRLIDEVSSITPLERRKINGNK